MHAFFYLLACQLQHRITHYDAGKKTRIAKNMDEDAPGDAGWTTAPMTDSGEAGGADVEMGEPQKQIDKDARDRNLRIQKGLM
jgi:hypothetical protein